MPKKYTAQGVNISPPLSWSPDLQEQKVLPFLPIPFLTLINWVVKNIPPDVLHFDENSLVGEVLANFTSSFKYKGPIYPFGTHRYFFKIYALDIEKMESSTRKEFIEEVEKHKIAEGVLIGKYKGSCF